MLTEVKLNNVYYKLERLPSQTLANQMASKIGQGTSTYGDLTTWSAWIQENWQEGVGRLRPHRQGGFLYGEAESRVPEQLILPALVEQVDDLDLTLSSGDCRFMPNNFVNSISLASTGTKTRTSVNFSTPTINAKDTTVMAHVYASAPVGTQITFAVYANGSSEPTGSALTTGTVTVLEDTAGYAWHGATLNWSGTLSNATTYWLVVYPTSGTMTLLGGNTSLTTMNTKSLVSGSWAAESVDLAYSIEAHRVQGTHSTNTGSGFFRFVNSTTSVLYHYMRGSVFKYDASNDEWDSVGAIGNDLGVTTAVSFNGRMYFGGGDGGSSFYMTDAEAFGDVGEIVTHYGKGAGYLWRATPGNGVSYSVDGTTWITTDEMYVGDRYVPITGMCAMGDSMYVSTGDGLYRVAPGDFGVPVAPWNSDHPDNGRCMVNFQGSLYITANNRVVRVSEDHQFQDVWVTREEDLAAGRLGKVWSLCAAESWLVALVGGGPVGSKPTLWALQENSWHHIATLPASTNAATDTNVNYSVYYDRITHRIWISTPGRVTYKVYVPEFAKNPYNDSTTLYAPRAWVEWDWFDGPVMEAYKDYDSIAIIGENITSARPVLLYWKDDASTTWELLGTATSNYQEIRWTLTGGTRPNTRRFKLGILLNTNAGASTPRVRAIRVKYHLMVRDWFRWNLQVKVGGRSGAFQMLADGTRNNLTNQQIKDNLDALCAQVAPFVYQDVDGTQYEVKIVDGNFQYTNWEYNESTTNTWWEGVYNLVLEMVTQDEYSA